MKTAIIIGATGLTGKNLLQQLINDERFDTVKVFTRRTTGVQHPKIQEHLINFDEPDQWKALITGDVLFSALGTTLKKAGSKEAQHTIDYTYQYNVAKFAAQNGVPGYVLVSSASADASSSLFYMRLKGELERDVKKLPFKQIVILQPGPLHGEREESRLGEMILIPVLGFLNKLGIAKKYRPISGGTLATAMINAYFLNQNGVKTFTLLQIFPLANQ